MQIDLTAEVDAESVQYWRKEEYLTVDMGRNVLLCGHEIRGECIEYFIKILTGLMKSNGIRHPPIQGPSQEWPFACTRAAIQFHFALHHFSISFGMFKCFIFPYVLYAERKGSVILANSIPGYAEEKFREQAAAVFRLRPQDVVAPEMACRQPFGSCYNNLISIIQVILR